MFSNSLAVAFERVEQAGDETLRFAFFRPPFRWAAFFGPAFFGLVFPRTALFRPRARVSSLFGHALSPEVAREDL
ncbi:MAG: hypothetical protein AMJ46_07160 [Latescibacteria bacterium DG_63]|nr:MAG: hypothetical protein AMJ46_07160 [Latescibacteria bacterium DG_63]